MRQKYAMECSIWNYNKYMYKVLIFTMNPSTSVAVVLQAHCNNKCARMHMLQLAQAQYKHSPSYTHTSSGTPNCCVASLLGVFSFWEVPVCCTWNTDLESGLVTSRTGVVNFASYLHQNISTTIHHGSQSYRRVLFVACLKSVVSSSSSSYIKSIRILSFHGVSYTYR